MNVDKGVCLIWGIMTSHYWHINFVLEGGKEYLFALRKKIPIKVGGLIFFIHIRFTSKKG